MTSFDKSIQSKLDCLIFFAIVASGWGVFVRDSKGNPRLVSSPHSLNERLNFPSIRRLLTASRRIRACAGPEAQEYKALFRQFKEARKRWKATSTPSISK